MQTSNKTARDVFFAALLIVCPLTFTSNVFPQEQAPSPEVPVVKVAGGPCMADFVVTDAAGKGLYDAKIAIQLEHGFLGRHKLDLRVGTNAEGKARIEGLPERPRRPAEFQITHGELSKAIRYDPVRECYARHSVILGG
jgi:hypothetical protein